MKRQPGCFARPGWCFFMHDSKCETAERAALALGCEAQSRLV